MGERSKIEWTDHTFNPWHGCCKVSPGCDHCYAERQSKRSGENYWGPAAPRRFFGQKHWDEPLVWNKRAAAAGRVDRVFCGSMCDVFESHENALVDWELTEARRRLWRLINETPNLRWLLLTKRSAAAEYILSRTFVAHAWLGVSVEDQCRADVRLPFLLKAAAAGWFISIEPMLGPVDLSEWIDSPLINWVIVGGESGPGARPVHPDWVRAVRDQCLGAGVPFFFKQWGEWRPYRLAPEPRSRPFAGSHDWGDGVYSQRVGKKRAGNVLDGVIWDQVPASGLLGRTES